VKPNRRSPVFRAAAWFFALALIGPAAMQGTARAQAQQTLKVIVADIVNRNRGGGENLGVEATAAVYNELLNTGAGRYYVFQTSEVQKEAQTLGIRTASAPGQPNNFSDPDLLRIARSLGADAVVEGSVESSGLSRGRPVRVSLDVKIHDMATDEDINGGIAQVTESPRPGQVADPEELLTKGVEDVAQDVVRQITQRQLFVATILNVNGNVAIMNIGTRNSLHVGDELTVYRQSPAGTIRVGRLKAARVYPGDAEADIEQNVGGIQIEDLARIIYRPNAVLPPVGSPGPLHNNPPRNNFSLGAIGATLTVIGLGVIVASSARGGQASVSAVTAEAGTQGSSPIVRVRFSDNVFGGAGVQQYKIFRLPDFPFGTLGTGNNNGGGGGGGGGGSVQVAGVPVGTATPTIREFIDLPSPNFRYANSGGWLVGSSNGGLNTTGGGGGNNGSGGGGGGGQQQGCTQAVPANPTTLDVGFLPGTSYTYQVTAVILRQANLSGSGNQNGGGGGIGGGGGGVGGGGGGGGVGGGGGGNGSGNQNGGVQCIETDPVQSGLATPLLPVIITSPSNTDTKLPDITAFRPTFASRTGADIFQLEISTDRTFKDPKRIFRLQLISTNPNSDGATQSPTTALNLEVIPELLADPVFAAYVTSAQSSTPTLPTIFVRVGARHDEDVPGPIHWISQNPSDRDKTFRFVYSQAFSFQPPIHPPPPPGGGKLAGVLNKLYNGKAFNRLPLPGDTGVSRRIAQKRVLTPQEILTGVGRGRH
jgi:hypothetical protein